MEFIDPRTDFGFKKIFGSKESKPILVDFLNSVMELPEGRKIVHLEILDPYQLPKIKELKYSILDVKCEDQGGRNYVVEMQLLEVEAFHKRIVYNVCKAYTDQLGAGIGYPELNQVVGITICDFMLFPDLPENRYITKHLLKEDLSNSSFLEEILFYFVELPKFTLSLEELSNNTERWLYFLKHTGGFQEVPEELRKEPLNRAFEIARRSRMSREELEVYEKYLIAKQDEIGALRLAEKRAEKRGEIRKAQDAVFRILKARFGELPKELEEKLRGIEELSRLDELISLSATCKSLKEFQEGL